MTPGRLVVRNVLAHPVRSLLLVLFAMVTLFLFAFLASVLTTLSTAISHASSRRLTVQSGIGAFAELPGSYLGEIAAVPGVESVSRFSWFGAYHRDPERQVVGLATDIDVVRRQYPEVVVSAEQADALMADRRGCLLGRRLAERLGVRVGDPLPLVSTTYPLPFRRPWEFTVRAVYTSADPVMPETILFFHWDFLEETRRREPALAVTAGLVTMYAVRVEEGKSSDAVAAAIDAVHAAGPVRTHTQTEAQHRASEIRMLGEIPDWIALVGGVALVAMAVAAANAMGIVAGERMRDVGILKALGFPDGTAARLLLAESALLTGGGGLLGLLVAKATVPLVRWASQGEFGGYDVLPSTIAIGTALSLAIGVVGAIPPAFRIVKVSPVEVLRAEG